MKRLIGILLALVITDYTHAADCTEYNFMTDTTCTLTGSLAIKNGLLNVRTHVLNNPPGTAGNPAGSDTQVQFNDGGFFGVDTGFTYNKVTDTLNIPSTVISPSFSGSLTGNASTATSLLVNPTDCPGGQYAIAIDASGNLTCAGSSAAAGGSNTQVQYNASGSLAGDDGLTYNATTDTLTGVNINATTFTGALSGNASTATTLVANPSDCTLPQVSLGINANGSAVCSQPSNITGSAATATTAGAFTADPSDCSGNNFALGITADGTATCAQPAFTNLSGTAGVTQGGTGQTSWGDNEMLVGTGVNTVARISLPAVACTASTAKILWDPAGNGTWSCGVDLGSPAGATNVLQTNNGSGGMGAYGGTSCSASNWVSALSNTGSATCTQPGFSNLSGSATAAQLPDATGAAKGAVVLAGALGGTADSPTVVDNSHNHNSTTVSALDASTDITTGSLPVARGGTAQTTWAADQVLVGTGSGTVARKGIPDCRTLSDKLQYDATNHIFSCAQDQTSESTPTDWTNASLLTGFTNIGSPFASTRYKKTPDGIVFIEVAVNRSANTQIFQLPSGYRPGTRLDLLGFYGYTAFTVGSFYITTDGYVTWNGTSGSGMRLNASFIATIPLTVTSTSSVYGYCFNASGGCQATTDTATCSASGGTGPYTYAWSYISGNTATVNSPSSASTTFTRTASGVVRTGVYRCTATDTVSGRTGTADTTVVTEHENLL